MADVRAVLRCVTSQPERPCSREAATAWRPAADSPSERSSACPRSRREVRKSVNLHGLAENRTSRAENAPRCKALIFRTSSALRPGRTSRPFILPSSGRRLAIASAICSSPFLRGPSLNCDRQNLDQAPWERVSRQDRCNRCGASLVAAGASRVGRSTEVRARERRLRCLFFADRLQENDKSEHATIALALRFDERRPHDRRVVAPPNCGESAARHPCNAHHVCRWRCG
jgi:hypothetical protein